MLWKSLTVAVFFLAGMIFDCNKPLPSITASPARPQMQTDGAIMLSGSGLSPATTYNVGLFTTGEPRMIGSTTTDSAGNINNVKLEYPCRTLFVGQISVEVYLQGGAGIAQTKTDGNTCF